MGSFLKKLKKYVEMRKQPQKNLAYDEHLLEFKLKLKAIISVRLESMATWLESTNTKINKIFIKKNHESVAEQGHFSKELEQRILTQIKAWIRQDDGFRIQYQELIDAYSPILKSADMLQTLTQTLKEFEEDLEEHVKLANKYAQEWKEKCDKISFTWTNRLAAKTFDWFLTLTTDTLKNDYEREIGKIKK